MKPGMYATAAVLAAMPLVVGCGEIRNKWKTPRTSQRAANLQKEFEKVKADFDK